MLRVFDPLQLTKEASLNRTLLADLPGADPALAGQRAFDVLRLEILHTLARQHGLHATGPADVPRLLSNALGDDSPPARAASARRVVAEFGRRLGHLVATLRFGDEDAGPWRTAYRQYWRAVDRIWLGGGVAAALGEDLLRPARAEAERLGVARGTLGLADHPDVLALIGAARWRTTPARRAIVLDFGYSSVKRGIAFIERDELQRLESLPAIRRPIAGLESHATVPEIVHAFVGAIATTVRQALAVAPQHIDPRIAVSLATYVHDSPAAAATELYDRLRDMSWATLEAELEHATGLRLQLDLLHDGTAAAAALQPRGSEGVVVLGSSLGAGFTFPDRPLIRLAEQLQVIRVSPD